MKLEDIKPSRQYQWVYNPEPEQWSEGHLKKGGRAGLAPNPLFGRVTVRSVKSGQAASKEMYVNKALALNPAWQPDASYTPRWEETSHPCVVRSLTTGDFQVRIMNSKTRKVEFLVDSRPATPDELALIKMYAKARKASDPTKPKIEFPYLASLANVDGMFADSAEDLEEWLG